MATFAAKITTWHRHNAFAFGQAVSDPRPASVTFIPLVWTTRLAWPPKSSSRRTMAYIMVGGNDWRPLLRPPPLVTSSFTADRTKTVIATRDRVNSQCLKFLSTRERSLPKRPAPLCYPDRSNPPIPLFGHPWARCSQASELQFQAPALVSVLAFLIVLLPCPLLGGRVPLCLGDHVQHIAP